MSLAVFFVALVVLVMLSGIFSGSETGMYSLSQPRIEAESRAGGTAASILEKLLSKKGALLVTLLVSNNLVLELATYMVENQVHVRGGLPLWAEEIAVTLGLTPILFFFGEVLPKDLFRRRPHQLLSVMASLLWLTRLVTLPLTMPLYGLSRALERLFRLDRSDLPRALQRQELLQLLAEGTRSGILAAPTEDLARNVLVLRQTKVSSIAVPWNRVETIDLDLAPHELADRVRRSDHSRLPALRRDGAGKRSVVGYLHQLDLLGAGEGSMLGAASGKMTGEENGAKDEKQPLRKDPLRTIPSFETDLPVHQALARLRAAGQRLALVGSPEDPVGLVTLMDLVSVIAGQAAFRPLSATANHG